MQATRKSKQRDAILDNLQHRYDHPTAMELYLDVRQSLPKLSLGTLYRNLKQLTEQNEIMCFSLGGEEHYDANTRRHYHLCCERCHRFYDLPLAPYEKLEAPEIPDFHGKIKNYDLIFYGICEACSKQNR